jgi:thiol-disulfide isomerase/thioredoxin
LTVDKLGMWIDDILKGLVKPYLKSEEPVKNEGSMKVVVGKNFDEIVRDPKKDVFIMLYAPWCGHCQSLAPIWDEMAE